MAKEGAIEMLIDMLDGDLELVTRQSAKALANLGVNVDNKRKIALAGGMWQQCMVSVCTMCWCILHVNVYYV